MARSGSLDSLGSYGDHSFLQPAHDHPSRRGTRRSSVFTLVATLVGGGCLSLPFAFQKVGIILGVVYLALSGIVSAYSMKLLLSCSRRTGAQNYEECGEKAFGKKVKFLTMGAVIILTFLASIAYLILARDLLTPLVESYIFGYNLSDSTRKLVSLCAFTPVLPLCFARSLHALRFASVFSLCSLVILTIAIVYKSIDKINHDPVTIGGVNGTKLVSVDMKDSFYALPMIELSFMAHFNLLPVHIGLRKPSQKRLEQVVHSTIFGASVFYLIISIFGYLFAYDHYCDKTGGKSPSTCEDHVPDNILNAFNLHEPLIDTGRLCFLTSLLLSFPLLVMPCRDTIIRLIKEINSNHKITIDDDDFDSNCQSDFNNSSINNENGLNDYVSLSDEMNMNQNNNNQRDLRNIENIVSAATPSAAYAETPGGEVLSIINTQDSPEFRTPHLRRQERRQNYDPPALKLCSEEGFEHILCTSFLLVLILVSFSFIPGVSVVWNVTGSSVGMFLAFIFPSSFYLKIRTSNQEQFFFDPRGSRDSKYIKAWLLFWFSIFMTIICTVNSIANIIEKNK